MTSFTEPAARWSPEPIGVDPGRRSTRLLLTSLALAQVALAAVAAVTLTGGRLQATLWLDLLVAAVLCGAIAVLARTDDPAESTGGSTGGFTGDAAPAGAGLGSPSDSALRPAAHRTGESFFDPPGGQPPSLPGLTGTAATEVTLIGSLLAAAVVPAGVALLAVTPWSAASSGLALVASGVMLRGRRLGVLWAVAGAAWAAGTAYGVAGALVAAANGTQVRVGELAPGALIGAWASSAVTVTSATAVAAVLSRHLTDARAATTRATDAARSRSVRDPLTGLSNRLGLEMVAGPMIENARRSGQAVHCLYLDVDDFRSLNELAGLHLGDEVLIAVAEAVLGSVRSTDVAARWDGDEFVVVGPGSGTSPLELERRVRAQLAAFPPVPAQVWSGRVSIGSAMLVPWDDGDLDSLLRRADQDLALRRSLRRQGRDRVAGAQGPLAARVDPATPAVAAPDPAGPEVDSPGPA